MIGPARRHDDLEPQVGVEVLVVREEAVAGVLTEHDPVHVIEVDIRVHDQPGLAGRGRLGERAGAGLAVAGIGMGRHEGRQPVAGAVAHPPQRVIGGRDLARIPTRLGRVLDPQLVGLGLVIAAVAQEHEPERLLRHIAVTGQRRRDDRAHQQADARHLLAGDLARGVARGDVADLMAHDPGELGLGVEVRQDAARDVDVAARHREGIDRRVVDHGEMPVQIGQLRDLGELHPHRGHVLLDRRVVVGPVLREHRFVALAAHPLFGAGGDEVELAPPAHRIGGAAGDQQGERGSEGPTSGSGAGTHGARC